jgi:hypothetical protein
MKNMGINSNKEMGEVTTYKDEVDVPGKNRI